jgi:hypothetical protein
MKSKSLLPALAALAIFGASSAQAQAMPGDEIRGQMVDVRFSDGTVNTIYFGTDGVATISSDAVGTVQANWVMEGQQLCLIAGEARECWAYAGEFQAATPMSMSSSCNETSMWTARAVNTPVPVRRAGERG